MIVERDLAVPMRDGTILRADVYRPDGGGSVPAVLSRTPYDRSLRLTPPAALDPERAVEAGFAMVCQDVRGQYGSEGEFYPFRSEGPDGYDTVEWIAAAPWSSGAVGMAGRSYAAATQWLAAAEQPPHLRAICPVVTGSNFYRGWIYQGGAFQLGFNLFWVHLMTDPRRRVSLEEQFRHLPLKDPPLLEESPAGPFYRDWLAHPSEDEFWTQLSIDRRYGSVQVPTYNVGGWYDLFLGGTLRNFTGMRSEGGSEEARRDSRLLIGPHAHGSTYGPYPDHSFPEFAPEDRIDLAEVQLRFFARHLRDEAHDPDDDPAVRMFVMGENRWRDEDEWPLARAHEERWYLRAGGTLSRERPGEEGPDEYVYDPADPAPTIGGPTSLPGRFLKTNSGPLDQRRVEQREDVLVYSSAPLQQPLEVTGHLEVVLHAATSANDADFVAKLCDVRPDGFSQILAEGVIRARYRAGFDRPRPLEPGRVEEYRVDLVATSNVFMPGHRVRVSITSSSFPRFDRNAGTGNAPGSDRAEDHVEATQTVFHDGARPSHVVLPIVRR